MTEHDDEFERSLSERLRASERRVPVTAAVPELDLRPASGVWRWALLGTAAAGLAVVAVAALLSQVLPPPVADSSPAPSAIPSVTATSESTAAAPSPTPSPTAAPTDTRIPFLAWEPIDAAAAEIRDLEWLGGRFVAVGAQDGRAAAWTLAPGGSWQAAEPIDPPYVAFDPESDQGKEFWMSTVVELDGELIGLGWQRIGCCDAGRAAIWTSEDGVTWTYVEPQGTPFGDAYHFPLDSVVSSTGEIVVVVSGLGADTTIWASPDGRSWTEHPTNLPQFPPDSAHRGG